MRMRLNRMRPKKEFFEMLQNAYLHMYLLAKIGADTAENEQHFAEILRKFARFCQL